jgi:hypothetical protein
MREILFRAKGKLTGKWEYGYLTIAKVRHKDQTATVEHVIEREEAWKIMISIIDPETVGQWTGMYDKNGVKIFEGDVLEVTFLETEAKQKYVVLFKDGGFKASRITKKQCSPLPDFFSLGREDGKHDIRVVGNVKTGEKNDT